MSELVWVGIDNVTWRGPLEILPVEIFDNWKEAHDKFGDRIAQWALAEATGIIRRAVFSRDNWTCTHCGDDITINTGHMHERVWRGRGGNVSYENSTTLCGNCHLNNPVAGHGKRAVQWS